MPRAYIDSCLYLYGPPFIPGRFLSHTRRSFHSPGGSGCLGEPNTIAGRSPQSSRALSRVSVVASFAMVNPSSLLFLLIPAWRELPAAFCLRPYPPRGLSPLNWVPYGGSVTRTSASSHASISSASPWYRVT